MLLALERALGSVIHEEVQLESMIKPGLGRFVDRTERVSLVQ